MAESNCSIIRYCDSLGKERCSLFLFRKGYICHNQKILDMEKGLWDNQTYFLGGASEMNAIVALTVIIILVGIIVLDSSDCLRNASFER